MRINPDELKAIREQIAMKDRAAFALGVAMIEYELEKMRLTDQSVALEQVERLTRLGAVQSEFDGYRATHMRVVVRVSAAQRMIGEAALARLGLASTKRVFTLDDQTGDVLELIAGNYVPVREVA